MAEEINEITTDIDSEESVDAAEAIYVDEQGNEYYEHFRFVALYRQQT